MKDKQKPQYNVLQNLRYTVGLVWSYSKLLVIFVAATSFLNLATSLVQLYIAPIILQKVEQSVPLSELLFTIVVFTGLLMVCSAVTAYLEATKHIGEMRVMHGFTLMNVEHSCKTSYANLMDDAYQKKLVNGFSAIFSDGSNGMFGIIPGASLFLVSLIGFVLYLFVLRGLHPVLLIVVIFTTAGSYYVGRVADTWNYNEGEESQRIRQRKLYIINLAMANEMPKDIRIFGMRKWLDDLWQAPLALWRVRDLM